MQKKFVMRGYGTSRKKRLKREAMAAAICRAVRAAGMAAGPLLILCVASLQALDVRSGSCAALLA